MSKEFPTNFEAKCEKGVGTPFPRVPAPLPTGVDSINQYRVVHKNAIDCSTSFFSLSAIGSSS